MKYFLILFSSKQPSLLNDTLLKMHIDFLKKLRTEGYLLICGPFTDNKGAVLIIQADSREDAEVKVKDDPFIKTKYYNHFVIHEFMAAGDENNWLSETPQTLGNLD